MLGLIASGLRGVAGAAQVLVQSSADVAKVVRDLGISVVSTPVSHALHLAHSSGQMIMNGSGQMIQLPGAGIASAGSAAQAGLSSLNLPTGGEGLAGLTVPAIGGGAGSLAAGSVGGSIGAGAAAAPPASTMASSGPTEYLGVLKPQGTVLPLMPEGIMRINSIT